MIDQIVIFTRTIGKDYRWLYASEFSSESERRFLQEVFGYLRQHLDKELAKETGFFFQFVFVHVTYFGRIYSTDRRDKAGRIVDSLEAVCVKTTPEVLQDLKTNRLIFNSLNLWRNISRSVSEKADYSDDTTSAVWPVNLSSQDTEEYNVRNDEKLTNSTIQNETFDDQKNKIESNSLQEEKEKSNTVEKEDGLLGKNIFHKYPLPENLEDVLLQRCIVLPHENKLNFDLTRLYLDCLLSGNKERAKGESSDPLKDFLVSSSNSVSEIEILTKLVIHENFILKILKWLQKYFSKERKVEVVINEDGEPKDSFIIETLYLSNVSDLQSVKINERKKIESAIDSYVSRLHEENKHVFDFNEKQSSDFSRKYFVIQKRDNLDDRERKEKSRDGEESIRKGGASEEKE